MKKNISDEKFATLPCSHCQGTGRVIDDRSVGTEMRRLREASGKSLRAVAGKLNLSAAYLSDLEQGRRKWSDERISKFRQAVKA